MSDDERVWHLAPCPAVRHFGGCTCGPMRHSVGCWCLTCRPNRDADLAALVAGGLSSEETQPPGEKP